MATQASVNGGQVRPGFSGPDTLMGNLTEFGSDVATLAELQAKLAAIDLKETVSHATFPVVLLAGSAVLALGALPVLLIGIASLLVEAGLSTPWAMILTALGAIVLAGVVGLLAWSSLGRSLKSLDRSKAELARNLSWIKAVVTNTATKRGRIIR